MTPVNTGHVCQMSYPQRENLPHVHPFALFVTRSAPSVRPTDPMIGTLSQFGCDPAVRRIPSAR